MKEKLIKFGAKVVRIAAIPAIVELNIGHYLISEAVFSGLAAVVMKMRAAMDRGRARIASTRTRG